MTCTCLRSIIIANPAPIRCWAPPSTTSGGSTARPACADFFCAGGSPPPWRLLRVASINTVKDYPILLRALAHVAAGGLDVHLDVVGEDTMNGAAHALTRTLGLDSCVTFRGFQPTDRLAAFYARAHLHLVPSRHEAAGVVILEAAASGLVTVGTAVGYVADWNPDRAVAVPVNDPNALAGAVVDLIQDPTRRARLASAAREWTLAHDADWTAQQFERIYAELVERR